MVNLIFEINYTTKKQKHKKLDFFQIHDKMLCRNGVWSPPAPPQTFAGAAANTIINETPAGPLPAGVFFYLYPIL
jgi:hypothetical protein